MADSKVFAKFADLAKPYAIGAAIGGGIASGFAAYSRPSIEDLSQALKPVITEQVRVAVSSELDPMRKELATARLHSEQAKNDAAVLKDLMSSIVSDMAEKVNQMAISVARIDERTKGIQ